MDILFWLVVSNATLFTLVWLVQLVIYPGLLHYSETELDTWHPRYTRQVSMIIAPLMFIQILLYLWALFLHASFYTVSGFALVLLCWIITFLVAVPIHQNIDKKKETFTLRQRLVRVNWYRTAAWTGSFILSVIEYGK